MKPQIIIFSTPTCRACKPYIAQVATAIKEAELEDDVVIQVVTPTDGNSHGVAVGSVPTTIIKYGDKIVAEFVGVTASSKIIDEIETILYVES